MERVLLQNGLYRRIARKFFEKDDVASPALVLNARGDVDGGAEVIDAIVEIHGNARPAMKSELHDHVAHLRLVMPELNEGFLNLKAAFERFGRREENGHHRVADRFDNAAMIFADDVLHDFEMLSNERIRSRVAD